MPLVKKANFRAEYQRMHREGEAAVREILGKVKDRHEVLVGPWKLERDTPQFSIQVRSQPGRIVGEVILKAEKAEQATLSVWQLLDRGTRVRYMMVSDDNHPAGQWESKTHPGQITSGPGAGVKTGLDFEDPRGGIKKREFAKNVAEDVTEQARDMIRKAYAGRS